MMGSVFEGEDIVQEALAKATEALPAAGHIENAERWLFTIAHHTALDALRRRKRHAEVSLDSESHDEPDRPADVDSWVAASASLATIMQLPVIQRSAVVLMDVLGYSLAETMEILGTTLPAVKAALHRGRARLKALANSIETPHWDLPVEERTRLRAYADTFNARDFDTLRNMLAEDTKLDLVNRLKLTGRKDVSVYFGRYDESSDWQMAAGIVEGRPAILVSDPRSAPDKLEYVVFVEWSDGRIQNIRDFRYARYIVDGLTVQQL
jgi:RNA polymerase sigma-70 factor (ECF subfamily)